MKKFFKESFNKKREILYYSSNKRTAYDYCWTDMLKENLVSFNNKISSLFIFLLKDLNL